MSPCCHTWCFRPANRMIPLFVKIEIKTVPRKQPRRPRGKIAARGDLFVQCGMRSGESLRDTAADILLEDSGIWRASLAAIVNLILVEAKASRLGGIALDLSGVDVAMAVDSLPGISRICTRHGRTELAEPILARRTASDVALAYPIVLVGFQDGWILDGDLQMPPRADTFDDDRIVMTQAVFDATNVAIFFAIATRQTTTLVMHPYLCIPEMVNSITKIANTAGIRAELEDHGLMLLDWTT